jgi:hypothetical protein
MSGLIDLREHFGIWDRCGNTRFFQKEMRGGSKLFLNALDGLRVSASPTRYPDGRVTYTLIVQDASKAADGDIEKSYEQNSPYPWIQRAVKRFFYFQAIGWALDAVKEYTGQAPLPGDRDMGNFLRSYEPGGKRYLDEGGSSESDKPMLEETLEAISRTIGGMKSTIVDYGKGLSEADVEEALADRGILEC